MSEFRNDVSREVEFLERFGGEDARAVHRIAGRRVFFEDGDV